MEELDSLKKSNTTYLLLIILFIGFSAFIILINYSTNKINEISHSEEYAHIKSAFNVEKKRLNELVTEYSYWDESYDKLIKIPDSKWANENLGMYLFDHLDIDLCIVVDENDNIKFKYIDGKKTEVYEKFDSVGINKLLTRVHSNLTEPNPQSGFFLLNNTPYLISLDNFIPDKENRKADGAFLLFGKKIDSKYINKIDSLYNLNKLQILTNDRKDKSSVIDFFGENKIFLFSLTWISKEPATQMLKVLILPIILIITIIGLLSFLLIQKDKKKNEQYLLLLESMALTDSLTGISNRRAFVSLAEREILRIKRTNKHLSLLMIDIDYFKKINDHLGHERGDEVLIVLTKLINNFIRDIDIFARWGGEEFCILLSNTNSKEALKTAERLRKRVENEELGSKIDKYVGTISIGISEFGHTDNINSLINRADNALYEAKRKGRNCCILST